MNEYYYYYYNLTVNYSIFCKSFDAFMKKMYVIKIICNNDFVNRFITFNF